MASEQDKERKKKYKAKKNKIRKDKRNARYREGIVIMRNSNGNIRLGIAMKRIDNPNYLINEPWDDSDSPTGMTQNCSYMGTCQYPCNGDC